MPQRLPRALLASPMAFLCKGVSQWDQGGTHEAVRRTTWEVKGILHMDLHFVGPLFWPCSSDSRGALSAVRVQYPACSCHTHTHTHTHTHIPRAPRAHATHTHTHNYSYAHCMACHHARGVHSSKGECATAVNEDTIKCAPQCLCAGSALLLHSHNCPTNDHACKGLHVSLWV